MLANRYNREYKPFKIVYRSKRILLHSLLFASAVSTLAFHPPLYNSDVSVSFDVINKDGKSFYQYPKEENKEIKELKRKKYIFLSGVVGHTNAGRIGLFKSTDYSYTGASTYIDDGTINGKRCWRIKFTTSGTFTPSKRVVIDLFLVGGGSGGSKGGLGASSNAGSGGAGGYTGTWTSIVLTANQAYSIVIGGGGAGSSYGAGNGGGASSAFGYSKAGGGAPSSYISGGSGGSGGAGGQGSSANGGSDGSNGGYSSGSGTAGTGQGTTTREFGEAGATLYSGGAGNGGGPYSYSGQGGIGGGGGGGNGGNRQGGAGYAGTVNTGGGGGGGGAGTTGGNGASGGSGICIIRNARS